jgi:hypothetical protein
MSDFGDATPEDSFDPTAPPDPEAVARIFVELERFVTSDPTRRTFDELHEFERAMLVFAFALLLARLKREGGL